MENPSTRPTVEARGLVISSLSPRCEMIFRNDFLEYFWDRHRAAEPFDNFSWAFLATNFNQEDHWFEGFISSQKLSSFVFFFGWNAASHEPGTRSHDCPQYLSYKKSLTLTPMENHSTNGFFFSINILGIPIFFYIFDMAESNSTIFPGKATFSTSNKPLSVATTCWPEFTPGFPEEVPGLGGLSREGGEGDEKKKSITMTTTTV